LELAQEELKGKTAMWVCLNNAFFSIVARRDHPEGDLLVRARRKGDIERVFGVPATPTPHRDYAYRALLSRADVGRVLVDVIAGITYDNFKSSVRDQKLHDAYASVWGVMLRLQAHRPWSGPAPRKGQRSLIDEPSAEFPFDEDDPLPAVAPRRRGRKPL
jgi:hypothetical protein